MMDIYLDLNLQTTLLLMASLFLAGLSNAVVGGGTVISFPVLLALGLPPVVANATNSAALLSGYMAAAYKGRAHIREYGGGQAVRTLFIVAVSGSVLGALLLYAVGNAVFEFFIPALLWGATLLFVLGQCGKLAFLQHRAKRHAFIGAAGLYGSFWGAGLGIILLALLSSTYDARAANRIKNMLSLAINAVGVVIFLTVGLVAWKAAAIGFIGALLGGWVGAWLVDVIPKRAFSMLVVALGVAVGAWYAGVYWF